MDAHSIHESQRAQAPETVMATEEDHIIEARGAHTGKRIGEDMQCGHQVQDLGWNKETEHIQPLTEAMNNSEIWTLIRRFNKQIFRVRSAREYPLTGLDMNDASGENISVERLCAHIERLYMTIIVSMYSLCKQIVRLRSWKEKPRTLLFLAVYSVSWLTGTVALTLTCFVAVLIVYPPARTACFPPVPPSLIDPKTGGVQEPLAGELASDSITGAPESHAGEAVEQEAHNFIMSIGKLMMNVSSGSHDENDSHEGGTGSVASAVATGIADLQLKAGDRESNDRNDKTKEPVSRAVQSFEIHPAVRILPDLIDNWERFGNALSPTSPFHPRYPRSALAACLLPLVLVFAFVSWDHVMEAMGFAAGLGFFGGPFIAWCVTLNDMCYPGWREYLQLRNTVLRGVPTNTQLAVTILRIGERNNRPLPPPPDVHQSPGSSYEAEGQHISTLGETREDIRTAIDPAADRQGLGCHRGQDNEKPKATHRVANGLKRIVKGGVQPVLKIGKAAAQIGGRHSKGSLGAFDAPTINAEAGPVCFPARNSEENGNAYITTTATTPSISWRRGIGDARPSWTVALDDIVELRKVGGMGWKRKFVISWATDCDVADGLVLKDKQGTEFSLTAVTMRDEVFNRLLSTGSQTWEMW